MKLLGRLTKAVVCTQPISLLYSVAKAEFTIWLALAIEDPIWKRVAIYSLAVALTLAFAYPSAWLAHVIQRDGLGTVARTLLRRLPFCGGLWTSRRG